MKGRIAGGRLKQSRIFVVSTRGGPKTNTVTRQHAAQEVQGEAYQLLPLLLRLIARGADEGAGDAVLAGSDIFLAMRPLMRSEIRVND